MGKVKPTANRILALDYLRGFFIVVIVIDHLGRWPSPLALVTGEGRLWVSAAEGFFIISGLLIGYVRGFKGQKLTFKGITKKLAGRALLLYAWSVGLTFVLTWLCWILPFNPSLVPTIPISPFDWDDLIVQTLIQQYVFSWAYFLKLYWIMLLLSIGAVYLFRKRLSWLVAPASVALWLLGLHTGIDWMQWQVLFFVPSVVGFHLEDIRAYFRNLPRYRRRLATFLIVGSALITAALSAFWTLGWPLVESNQAVVSKGQYEGVRSWLDAWFTRDPVAWGRVVLSFLWLAGLILVFNRLLPILKKWFNWLLFTFGTRSLSAYTVHGFVLCAFQLFVPLSNNILLNLLIASACVLTVWGILRIPFMQRLLPI